LFAIRIGPRFTNILCGEASAELLVGKIPSDKRQDSLFQ
jgi:hypothetical protein